MKKHYTQMTQAEIVTVSHAVKSVKRWSMQSYAIRRVAERGIDGREVFAMLQGEFTVIEVHNDKTPDVRALLRNARGLCIVVSLSSFHIITVYENRAEDNHSTLDWSKYRWQDSILGILNQIKTGE